MPSSTKLTFAEKARARGMSQRDYAAYVRRHSYRFSAGTRSMAGRVHAKSKR